MDEPGATFGYKNMQSKWSVNIIYVLSNGSYNHNVNIKNCLNCNILYQSNVRRKAEGFTNITSINATASFVAQTKGVK